MALDGEGRDDAALRRTDQEDAVGRSNGRREDVDEVTQVLDAFEHGETIFRVARGGEGEAQCVDDARDRGAVGQRELILRDLERLVECHVAMRVQHQVAVPSSRRRHTNPILGTAVLARVGTTVADLR